MKLVILDGHTVNPGDLSWDWLSELVDEYEVYDYTEQDEIFDRCHDAEIVVANKVYLSKETIFSLPNLKYISTIATGYNLVECEAARKRGISVSNIPSYSSSGVAQSVFALIFELTNQVGLHNQSVIDGEWSACEYSSYWKMPISEICGKTLGIIGFGHIGSIVAKIALAFGMKVKAYSPHTHTYDFPGEVEFVSLDEVVRCSDILSLHCPLLPITNKMVNKEFLSKMKSSALLINTARGQIINEEDLADALKNKVIAGAGLDVLTCEPPQIDNPLIGLDNCFITPHNAWSSIESRTNLINTFKANIEGFVSGNLINVVN